MVRWYWAGCTFRERPGLDGHSDADVVLHALMDALLGGAGLGDIGRQFPPADPAFKGADSRELARTVVALIAGAGFQVRNVDLTLLAERPMIRPHVLKMKESLADSMGLDSSRVGLKATTLEGMGALGRGEGIGCQAVALLARQVRR